MTNQPLRVMLDTNVFLSYIIRRRGDGSVVEELVQAAFDRRFVLLVSAELVREIRDTLTTKPYFVQRIDASRIDQFIAILTAVGEAVPPISGTFPSIARDPDDDFLIFNAVMGQADYLVSGDRHVLELGDRLAPIRIRTPKEFADELRQLS